MSSPSYALLVDKLVHPLAEIRQRSCHSLRSKLDAKLVDPLELGRQPDLASNLLSLTSSPGVCPTTTMLTPSSSATRFTSAHGSAPGFSRWAYRAK